MTHKDFFTNQFPEPSQIMEDIEKEGYKIYQNAINPEIYEEIRNFWLNYFSTDKPQKEVVRGGFSMGEENFNAFTDTNYWRLYRHFDFLWNDPTHEITNQIMVELHKKRNLAIGTDEDEGLVFSPMCHGMYVSTSYYPPNIGMMTPHEDGLKKDGKDLPLLHFMFPVTFKGQDYEGGGLSVWNKKNEKIDVDELMKPGDVVFYLGSQKHGVDTILPYEGKEIGRLAIFSIPVIFLKHKVERSNEPLQLDTNRRKKFWKR